MMLPTLLTTLLLACGDKNPDDSGIHDSGIHDTGPTAADGGAADGGAADGGASDGGAGDGGEEDGGTAGDGGGSDGGTADGGGEDCPDPTTWYYDADGDGYGAERNVLEACDPPPHYVDSAADCDDLDPQVSPAGTEICADGIDQDCDGLDLSCGLPDSGELAGRAWKLEPTLGDEDARNPMSAGDIDGDGLADIVVGDPRFGSSQGRVMVFRSPIDADHSEPDLELLFAAFQPDYPGLGSGTLVPGDLTGDGLPDLVATAPDRTLYADDGGGGAWVVPGPITAGLDPMDDGLWLAAPLLHGNVGENLAGGGDLTGDGIADLVLNTNDGDGYTYVVAGPITAGGSLTTLAWSIAHSEPDRHAGQSLAAEQDLDGDGVADLVIGMPSDDSGVAAGRLRLLQGPITGDLAAGDWDSLVVSSETGDRLGWRMVTGDLDGDGTADVLASAIMSDAWSTYAGMIYGVVRPFDSLTRAAADADYRIGGSSTDYLAGVGLALVDLDGNGHQDLFVTCMDAKVTEAQVRGLAGPFEPTADLDGADGIWLDSTVGHYAGWWLEAVGDATGDGIDDLLVGGVSQDTDVTGHSWLLSLDGPERR